MNDTFRLSDSIVETFARDGVVCIRSVFNRLAIAALGNALNELTGQIGQSATGYDVSGLRRQIFEESVQKQQPGNARQHDIEAIIDLVRLSRAPSLVDRSVTGNGHFTLDTTTWRRNRTVRLLALDSCLPEIAAQLLGANKVNFCDDQIFVKEPGTADRTAFHQDYTYFRMQGWQGCVMWICADYADVRSGALCYVRGSHLWERKFVPNVFLAHVSLPGGEGESLEEIENHPERFDLIRFDVQPGDIVVHHFRTIHGAGGNGSNHTRRALSLRYAGEDMRYHLRPGAPEQPYHSHRLSEGDALDSEDFPVVWPKPFPGFSLCKAHYDRGEIVNGG